MYVDAAKTYYRTLSQKESLDRRGKSRAKKEREEAKRKITKGKSLLKISFCLIHMHMCVYIYIQKLFERQRIFEKLSYKEKDTEKWIKYLFVT